MHTQVTGRVPWTLWDGQRLVHFRICRACSLLRREKSGLSVEPMRTLRHLSVETSSSPGKRSTGRLSAIARQTCVSPTALHLCQSLGESQPILRPAAKSCRTLSKALVIASSTTQTQQRITSVAGCRDGPYPVWRDGVVGVARTGRVVEHLELFAPARSSHIRRPGGACHPSPVESTRKPIFMWWQRSITTAASWESNRFPQRVGVEGTGSRFPIR